MSAPLRCLEKAMSNKIWIVLLSTVILLTGSIILGVSEISWVSRLTEVSLESGEGKDHLIWGHSGDCWSTSSNSCCPIEIIQDSDNKSYNSIWSHFKYMPATFFLRLKADSMGTNPKITVRFLNGSSASTIFRVVGEPGSHEKWDRSDGSSRLSISWTENPSELTLKGLTCFCFKFETNPTRTPYTDVN